MRGGQRYDAGVNEGIVWLLDPRIVAPIADSGLLDDLEVPALAVQQD